MTPIGFLSWFYPRKWSCNVAAAMWRLGCRPINSKHPRNDWAKCSQDAKMESEGRWAKCQEEVGHVRHVPRERFVNVSWTVWPSKLCLLGLCLLNSLFGRIGIWDDTHNYWVTWASHTHTHTHLSCQKETTFFQHFFGSMLILQMWKTLGQVQGS